MLADWCLKQAGEVVINDDKTIVVHFRQKCPFTRTYTFNCGNLATKYKDRYKYLGL